MSAERIKNLKPEEFRRLTGVKLQTFDQMVQILSKAIKLKKAKGGRPSNLSTEEMLLTRVFKRIQNLFSHS